MVDMQAKPFNLTGKLLISAPAMRDPRFAHSVIYLCTHSYDGAFGFVLNAHIPGLSLRSVLEQLAIPAADALPENPVRAGGPVETERGFVLYRGANAAPDSEQLDDGLFLTCSPAILAQIGRGEAPEAWFLALGYAGWGPGQLEAEIRQNGWLTCEADPALLFGRTQGLRTWNSALRSMGIDPGSLSSAAGRA